MLAASRHDALPVFSTAMLAFVIPLTIITFAVIVLRSRRRRRAPDAPQTTDPGRS
jgi:cation:H+ antiporter